MIARTNKFKDEIKKLGKEIDFKFALHTNDKLITEDGKFLINENNLNLVVEQLDTEEVDYVINSEDIYNVSIIRKGNLLSTMMKEVDFEIKQDLRFGDVVDCSFGLKVDGNYEYINYGKFIIYSKEHNEDTDTYSYVAYDSMLLSMIDVDDVSIIQGVTVQQAIENICDKVGLTINITDDDLINYPNLTKTINSETFNNIEMTYRDVLNQICQCLGLTMVSNNKQIYLKPLNRTVVDSFDEEYLKDVNVKFSNKHMINSVVLSRSEESDNLYRRDEDSVSVNGVHEFKIKDNLIMLYDDREDYIDEIFNQLNGIEFYINDFTSTGITYLEPLDFYNIVIGGNTYQCLMLNDEIKIQQGLEESIYTEMPEETTTEYKTAGKTDKEVSFIFDKQNGRIKGTVQKDDIIASLNVAVEDGQGIVELKGNTVTIDSDYFTLDAEGRIQATSGLIGGFELNNVSFSKDVNGLYNYNTLDAILVRSQIMNEVTLDSTMLNILDVNESGDITPADYVTIMNIINNEVQNTKTASGTFEINSNNPKNCLIIKDENGKMVASIGVGGVNAENITGNNCVIGVAGSTDTFVAMDGARGNVYATGTITQGSLESIKKNFEKFENGLDIIKDIDIYKYNLKSETDDEKKHIGFVIGDNFKYNKDITNENNNGVDVYSFVSVCCKAIQEQQEQIEELKREIKSLKGDDI